MAHEALSHEEPDRIPIDLGGFQTGIHKKAYEALIGHLGLTETIRELDPIHPLAEATLRDVEAYPFPDGRDPNSLHRRSGDRSLAAAEHRSSRPGSTAASSARGSSG